MSPFADGTSAIVDEPKKRTVGVHQIRNATTPVLTQRSHQPRYPGVCLRHASTLAERIKFVELVKTEATAERTLERVEIRKWEKLADQIPAFEDHPVIPSPPLFEPELSIKIQSRVEVP